MATTRLTEKISQLVSGQLPEFLRNDYPLFVSLIEAYYRYLEQDQQALELVQNSLSYNDIDRTASSFVQYFLKNYASNIPLTAQLNKKFLVKKINDLYESKGSELSFKLLFKLLYDVSVEQSRPYDFVLKPSDGIWDQRVSLRIERISGSTTDLNDRFIYLTKNGIEYRDAVIRVKNLITNLYEVFLKSTTTTPYQVGDTVEAKDENNNIIFTGVIKPTAVNYSISQSGAGFREGQVFTVSLEGVTGTIIRVLKVNASGGIELLKILNYGYGFTGTSLSIDLYNDLTVASRTKLLSNQLGGFKDTVTLTLPHTPITAARYFDADYVVGNDYTGTVLVSVTTDNTTTPVDGVGENDAAVAVISFEYGAIARYPGQYLSSKGFLSEPVVKLQDDKLYQPFAYQLESDLDISYFYDTVLQLVHPAGTKLFNNRIIQVEANVRANVSVITRANIFLQLESTYSLTDALGFLYYITPVDNVTTIDSITRSTDKSISDSASVIENLILSTSKTLEDSASTSDSTVLNIGITLDDSITLNDDLVSTRSYFRTLDSNITPADSLFLNSNITLAEDSVNLADNTVVGLLLTPLSDSLDTLESLVIQTTKGIADDIQAVDSLTKTISTNINNTVSNVTLTETANATITSYAEPGYFSELYEGSIVTLI